VHIDTSCYFLDLFLLLEHFTHACRHVQIKLGGCNYILFFVAESIMILHSELKRQRKLVKNLKKKSLWSRTLEEVNFQPYSLSCFIVYTVTVSSLVFANIYMLTRHFLVDMLHILFLTLEHLLKNADIAFVILITADCGETCGHRNIFAQTNPRFI
jgi:hypothetical protein